eukprot:SAG22_NODE_729_length_7596_cov_20.310924_4_plen_307_part_00
MKHAAADTHRVARWVQEEPDPWIHAFPAYDWHDDRLQVTGLDAPSRTAVINCSAYGATPCPEYAWVAGARWLGFNLLSELDEPGEYHVDHGRGMLYWWPPAPSPAATQHDGADTPAYVTLDGVALHVEGGREWDRPVQHLVFENLTFAHGRLSAAVLREVANISLVGCSFINTGGQGLFLAGADTTISGGHVSGVSGAGIVALGGNSKALSPGGLLIDGVTLRDHARVARTYNPAIQFGYPDSASVGTRFANLRISDGPHQAFSGYCNDCIFEYNEVAHVGFETADPRERDHNVTITNSATSCSTR